MSVLQVIDVDARPLGRLFDCGTDETRAWQPGELGEIVRQLWSAPLQFDVDCSADGAFASRPASEPFAGPVIETFGDLLQHPRPPVGILELVKGFAKARYEHPDSPMPRPIALLLYFLSIALALVRHDRRITSLDDCLLRRGFRWYASQRWVDEAAHAVFEDGLKRLACQGRPDCCQPPIWPESVRVATEGESHDPRTVSL